MQKEVLLSVVMSGHKTDWEANKIPIVGIPQSQTITVLVLFHLKLSYLYMLGKKTIISICEPLVTKL